MAGYQQSIRLCPRADRIRAIVIVRAVYTEVQAHR
jgi:hypothetical protein